MRVAIYLRVSTQKQAEAHTIEQQRERLTTYAAQQGWAVSSENFFRDEGYSGARLQRPGLDHLRDRVAAAAFDRILITAPDRLARNYVHQLLLLEELERFGCKVEFLDRPMSHDPHDQLLLQIRGAVAEYERTLITERMRRGRQRKLAAGLLLPWTRPPYGYRVDPDQPRSPAGVRQEETEAAVVASIFTRYTEGGVSLCGIAQQLQQEGVPTPQGKPHWGGSTVRRILRNPVYTGQLYANRLRNIPVQGRCSALRPIGHPSYRVTVQPRDEWLLSAPFLRSSGKNSTCVPRTA
jgi:site-specific DNA recombinase